MEDNKNYPEHNKNVPDFSAGDNDCNCPLQTDFSTLKNLYGPGSSENPALEFVVTSGNDFLKNVMNHINYFTTGSKAVTFLSACPGTDGSGMANPLPLPLDGYQDFQTATKTTISQVTTALNNIASNSSELCGPFAMLGDLVTTAQTFLNVTDDFTTFNNTAVPLFPKALYNQESTFSILNQISNIVNKLNKLATIVLLITVSYTNLCQLTDKLQQCPSKDLKEQTSCLCGFSSIFERWGKEVFSSGLTNLLLESSDALYSIPTCLGPAGTFPVCPASSPAEVFLFYTPFYQVHSKVPGFVKDFSSLLSNVSTDINTFINCPTGSCSPGIREVLTKMQSIISNTQNLVSNYMTNINGKTIFDAFNYGLSITSQIVAIEVNMNEAVSLFYRGCPKPPATDPGCPREALGNDEDMPGDSDTTWCCKKC